MEKDEIQQEADQAIEQAKAMIADPATPPAHKSVISVILGIVLKFLPVIIDIFHHASVAPAAAAILNSEPEGPLPPKQDPVEDQSGGKGAS